VTEATNSSNFRGGLVCARTFGRTVSNITAARTVLPLNEPTANLDHKTGETVVRMLRDLCSTMGVTVVASTHDPTVAGRASRVVRMKDGQIVN